MQQIKADVEETLFRIDKLRQNNVLDHEMYDIAVDSMAISQEYSLDIAFSKNKFWTGLSP